MLPNNKIASVTMPGPAACPSPTGELPHPHPPHSLLPSLPEHQRLTNAVNGSPQPIDFTASPSTLPWLSLCLFHYGFMHEQIHTDSAMACVMIQVLRVLSSLRSMFLLGSLPSLTKVAW